MLFSRFLPKKLKKWLSLTNQFGRLELAKLLLQNKRQEIHAHIRSLIAAKYGQEVANEISILYGGSVKPDNAKEIFSQPDIDGGLIGGAALKLEDFSKIIEGFNQ